MALRGTAAHINSGVSTTNAVTVSGIGIQLDDVVILAAVWVGTGATFTLPSGFATIPGLSNQNVAGTQTMMALAYKVATASEPASYTVTSSSNNLSIVRCRVYSGRIFTPTTSIFTAVSSTANTAGTTPITYALTGVTAAASDDVVEFVANQYYQGNPPGFTQPPGYANSFLDQAGVTDVPILASCDYQGAPAGLTGTNGGRYTNASSGLAYAGYQISLAALNPDTLTSAPGAFAMTGAPAAMGPGIASNPGAFAMTGQASLLFVGASGYELLSAPGSFFFTGANAAEGFEVDSSPGAFTISGQDMALFGSLFITSNPGSFIFSGGFAAFSIFTPPPPSLPVMRVMAVTAGYYRGEYYVPGDVFDLYNIADFSDSGVNYQQIAGFTGAGFGQFAFGVSGFGLSVPISGTSGVGWMVQVPSATPLYQWVSATPYPAFPALDPLRRFVY